MLKTQKNISKSNKSCTLLVKGQYSILIKKVDIHDKIIH